MAAFNFQKAIQKYALLLLVMSLIFFLWNNYFENYFIEVSIMNPDLNADLIKMLPSFTNTAFNIVLAIMVYRDFKSNDIKSPLIVIITLLFGFIGVALFFILLMYNLYILKNDARGIKE